MAISDLLPQVFRGLRRDASDALTPADRAIARDASTGASRQAAAKVFGSDQFIRRFDVQDAASGAQRKLLASAAVEGKDPSAFVLSPDNADFRSALAQVIDPNRQKFIAAIKGNPDLMNKFQNWNTLAQADQVATLKQVSDLEGQVMGFTPPPIVTKPGVPGDGTLGFFAPDPQGGLGSVTLFPDAIAKADNWTPLVTISHEMEHAHQDQIVKAAAAGQFAAGSPEATLAKGFSSADQGIEQVGGENKLNYGDYAHLNNEYDAFRFGNPTGAVVSDGAANTSDLGFVDAQFDKTGAPLLDINQLAQQVGPDNLLSAVNQKELAFIKALQQKTA